MGERLIDLYPDEITRHILSWLPVKSLLRFSTVNKHWNSTISDPGFKISKKSRLALLTATLGSNDFKFFIFLDDHGNFVRIPWEKSQNTTLEFCGTSRVEVLGSCNGLLLLLIDGSFFLWNPSTRVYKKVLELGPWWMELSITKASGFCYDSSTDDYKVVVLREHYNHLLVGSVKLKSWEKIDEFPDCLNDGIAGPVVNGFLHWNVAKSGEFVGKIVRFVTATNVFDEMPLPDHPERSEKTSVIVGLGSLDKCLCVSRWVGPNDYSIGNLELLVMKEYGVKESWTTMFVMDRRYRPTKPVSPLVLMDSGEEVLLMKDTRIISWNRTINRVTYPMSHYRDAKVSSAAIVVESLVSPLRY